MKPTNKETEYKPANPSAKKKPYSSTNNHNKSSRPNQYRHSSQKSGDNTHTRYGNKKQYSNRQRPANLYVSECSKCKKTTQVPFKPDGVRPVYCKECLKEVRATKNRSR